MSRGGFREATKNNSGRPAEHRQKTIAYLLPESVEIIDLNMKMFSRRFKTKGQIIDHALKYVKKIRINNEKPQSTKP